MQAPQALVDSGNLQLALRAVLHFLTNSLYFFHARRWRTPIVAAKSRPCLGNDIHNPADNHPEFHGEVLCFIAPLADDESVSGLTLHGLAADGVVCEESAQAREEFHAY